MTRAFIPVDQLEEGHALVLGTTGSGKTYRLRGFLEQLRRADRRVGAVDKLGNHWGLTLAADGTDRGLDFVIFGGKRGHVPMTPADGDRLGCLFVERNIPAIFDVSQWHADDQNEWIAGFADAVFQANEGALHLAFDEAQSWVPQGGGGDAFKAVRRLAEQGRGNGIRLLLSCQRLSRLDATVRGMMHSVISMRQTGVIDRRAVVDLISASKADTALIEGELPKLPTGTGYLWTADDTDLKRVAFPPNDTFDSSRTPRHGDSPPAPIAATSALVDELRALLAPPAAEAHPDDVIPPGAEAAYARGSAVGAALADRDRRIAQLEATIADQRAELEHLRGVDAECERHVGLRLAIERLIIDFDTAGLQAVSTEPAPNFKAAVPDASEVKTVQPGRPRTAPGKVRGRKALAALAGVAPAALTEAQWATIARYAKTGGTWGTYKGELRAAGFVEQLPDGTWRATAAGVAVAGADVVPLPAPGIERAAFWGQRVPGVSRMVAVLAKRWPHYVTRGGLAEDLDMAAAGGTFGTYLGRLRTNGLLDESGKRLRLAAEVMGDAK